MSTSAKREEEKLRVRRVFVNTERLLMAEDLSEGYAVNVRPEPGTRLEFYEAANLRGQHRETLGSGELLVPMYEAPPTSEQSEC